MTAGFAILLGNLAHSSGRASSPGVGKSCDPGTSFASELADQVQAQGPQTKSLASQPLASKSSGARPSPKLAGKPAAKADEAAEPSEPVDPRADTRADDDHALDALALHAKEPALAGEAAHPTKSGAKPAAEKSAASAKTSGAPIAQAGAQSAVAQLESRVEGKPDADSEPQAGAGSNSSKSGDQPAVAAKKVAASVLKAPLATESAQASKPLPTATSVAPSTTSSSSTKPTGERPGPVPFAHEAESDPSLHVSLLPQAAHLRMEVEGAGDLSLHLRMRDGLAHVTVSGAAAPLIEMRSSDLRSALAGQGLSLGQLEQVTASSTTNLGDAQGQQLAQDNGAQSQGRDTEDRDDESRKSAPGKAARNSSAFTISRSTASKSGQR